MHVNKCRRQFGHTKTYCHVRRHSLNTSSGARKVQFIIDIYPAVRAALKGTGMSWELMLAEAAEETGWGQRVLPGTRNIYNIKAGEGWKGISKSFLVLEFVRGKKVGVERRAEFRVYGSYRDAIADRVALLRRNPVYRAAGIFNPGVAGDLEKEAFALQKAGYATDPGYARKIIAVFKSPLMQRAIKDAQERELSRPAPLQASSSLRARIP